MTYPDRDTRRHRWVGFVILIFLTLYIAFAVEAKMTEQVCISAMTVDNTGAVTSSPVFCQ